MPLRIVHFNDPILRQKGRNVTVFDADLAKLAQDMIAAMHTAEGIGLAAQQIGRALQLCVVDLLPMKRNFSWVLDGVKTPLELIMPMVLINPSVVALPSEKTPYEEGCLSFPEIRGDVVRPHRIAVRYQDLHGIAHTLECDGIFARCIQHEVDHLNGTLFIDRMEKKIRAELEPAIRELAQRTRDNTASAP
ncbi:MAG: peptide deformylase [Opitutaceae bacterium]|nr:peptide deformylase [Opitutaceae bacterium]